MPHYSEDRCTRCGQLTSAERLTVRRVSFSSRKTPNKVIRSRVRDWLCPPCLEGDSDWNAPAFTGPGHRSEALERVRASGRGVATRTN